MHKSNLREIKLKVIGVRFKSSKKIYYFSPNGFDVQRFDNVIVETSRGIEFGQAVIGIKDVDESEIVPPLQNVIRIATEQDVKNVKDNEERQKEAFERCRKKIEEHKLNMKLVEAEYAFDNSKLVFYFTSDERVDFRELVKDLATMFKTRIELRQIAVRDETKMLGGLGACGNEICCKRFLGDFASVSIKMAKEQSLSLNPTKISGLCGRLICCLNYEKDFYDEMNKKLPNQGERVLSPKGNAEVVATYPLKESVRVKYTNPDGSTDSATFHLDDITRLDPSKKCECPQNIENDTEAVIADSMMNPAELEELAQITDAHDKKHDNQKQRERSNKRDPKRDRRPNKETADKPNREQKQKTEDNNTAEAEAQSNEQRPHHNKRRNERPRRERNNENAEQAAPNTEENKAPGEKHKFERKPHNNRPHKPHPQHSEGSNEGSEAKSEQNQRRPHNNNRHRKPRQTNGENKPHQPKESIKSENN